MTIDTQALRLVAASVRAFLRPEYGREIAAAADHIDALTALAASKTEQCSALRTELDALRAATNPELLASERAANAVLTVEVERLRTALEWTAAALQFACTMSASCREAGDITIAGETRTIKQILDAADAALAQEGS